MEDQGQQSPSLQIPATDLFPTICQVCREQNLIQQIHLVLCLRCNREYCIHFASTVDPSCCSKCCFDVTMTDETIYKKTEHYNEELDKVYTKTSKARQIKFGGLDWLFYQRRIKDLNDTELLLAIEYHHAIYTAMVYERDQRRAEHAHRNAGKKITFAHSANVTSETTTKRTKTVKATAPDAAAANIKALLEVLIKQGKTPQEIMAMFAKGTK